MFKFLAYLFGTTPDKKSEGDLVAEKNYLAKSTVYPNPHILTVRVAFKHKGSTVHASLALDTGASTTMISEEIARALGIDLREHIAETELKTAGGMIKVRKYRVGEIGVQKAKAKSLTVIVRDLPGETPIGGLLGLNFLAKFNLDVDFDGGWLYLR